MNVVLGVSGSIAAYRAADLARDLMRLGHTVRACLTYSAAKFVTPTLFEALTGEPCLIGAFEEPERGHMAHIEWARWADVVVVAPATANLIAKLAHGIADDMLTTLVSASEAPLVVAPAMNPHMYASEANQEAVRTLAARAAAIVAPSEGDVACGEHGQGKLASNAEIVATVTTVLSRSRMLAGKHVLITSGPTQEPIDDVRFLTNRSSGKMGAALARAALLMGAEVTVVAGPSSVFYPLGADVIRVRTASEMLEAGLAEAPQADLVIGAAAVADYRPAAPMNGKMRRGTDPIHVPLVPNPDVIAEIARANPEVRVIGFAAEPSSDLEEARRKLVRKGLFAIAVNDVSRSDIGFDTNQNELTVIFGDREPVRSPLQAKLACALWLLEQVG